MRIAIIDDDPLESILLSELGQEIDPDLVFIAYASMDAYLGRKDDAPDLVLLDRRLPPYSHFSETLPLLAQAGFAGRVVLMTAHDPGIEVENYPFAITGPVDKLDLLKPERLEAVIRQPHAGR